MGETKGMNFPGLEGSVKQMERSTPAMKEPGWERRRAIEPIWSEAEGRERERESG